MSIFSKKSRPREPDDKSKQQQSTNNTSKPDSNRYLPKNASAASISNYVLSAGDRTVQRAQIMAASRKRMNSDTPDYSIKGSAKSKPYGATAPPSTSSMTSVRPPVHESKSEDTVGPVARTAKTPPQKLSKPQKPSKEGKKSRNSSTNDLSQITATATTGTANSAAKPPSQNVKEKDTTRTGENGNVLSAIQRTPPLRMDSPTLGYTPSQEGCFGGFLRPQPSSDSGYGSKTPSTANSRTPSDANAAKEAKSSHLPRIDSGFIPKLGSSKELVLGSDLSKRTMKENKSLIVPPPKNTKEQEQSKSGTYVSRLDPGPATSLFADPVELARTTMLERGRDNGQKPAQSRVTSVQNPSQIVNDSQAQPVREMRSTIRQARRYEQEQPFMPKIVRASTPPPAKSAGVEAQREAAARTYTLPSSPSSNTELQRNATPNGQTTPSSQVLQPQQVIASTVSNPSSSRSHVPESQVVAQSKTAFGPLLKTSDSEKRDAAPSKPQIAEPQIVVRSGIVTDIPAKSIASETRDVAPLKADASSQSDSQHAKTQLAGSASAAALPQTRSVPFENEASLRDLVSAPPAITQQPPTEPVTSNLPEIRSALPPLSVLEGFRVNKRGHVLDEEGDVIGELFEGDIIDCVRQKANAYGDVLDEFGSVVGRVRTVPRGSISTPRFSISSATGMHPAFASYQSDRRESNASQQTQLSFLQAHRGSVSHVHPPAVHGNVLIAELDASTKTEAGPVVDHSEIFSPFGAPPSSKGSESPSTISRTELPADERQLSQPKVPELKQEPLVADQKPIMSEQKPKKWTSRYFEPASGDGHLLARRYSNTTAPTAERTPEPKSSQMLSSSLTRSKSRAVIGPTLESLLEQESAPSSPSDEVRSESTPNLPLDATRTAMRSPSPGSAPRQSVSSQASGASSSVSLPSTQQTSAATTIARPSSIQFGAPAPGLGAQLSVRSSYGNHQPARRSPLASYETTPPGSGAGNANGKTGTMTLQTHMPRTYITKSGKVTVESDDAAPSPDIPMARNNELKGTANPVDSSKTVEKRKSRFSFMLNK